MFAFVPVMQAVIHSRIPVEFTCNNCTHCVLPFHSCRDFNTDHDTSNHNEPSNTNDTHLEALRKGSNNLKLVHLNTQSLVSSFNEFLLTFDKYKFDLITMSETWLKDNDHLLSYVNVPGYDLLYNNRDKIRGGGVECYINSQYKYQRKKEFEALVPDLENLW